MALPADGGEERAAASTLRCVNCGWGMRRLFMQYSPGNIRLMKCGNCKGIADPYIECEYMIVLLDLTLHKTEAYRHLLYNAMNLYAGDLKGILWKSSLVYFILDICRLFLLKRKEISDDWNSSTDILVSSWTCGKAFSAVLSGIFMFVAVLLLGTKVLLSSSFSSTRYKDMLLAILVSSYFKLYLITMLVWEFPSSVTFIVDLFVMSSNAVALHVLMQSSMARCAVVCFIAHAAKFFTNHCLLSLFWKN